LAGPFGRSIAQASDADPARQSSFDGSLHEVGREERERDRHIDLSNAAFVTGGLYALAAFALMAAVVSAVWLHIPRRIAVQEVVAAA
jgi:hypothetical protein